MKIKLFFLIGFFASQILFAQNSPGIAVQGIARDAEKAALVDQLLTFTFDIQDNNGESFYKEEVKIKTDPYGVFSHIIGSSVDKKGDFDQVPFDQSHLKLVIAADGEIITNSPFQYSAYARSAGNGVPTGTIMAFAGKEADVPSGWVLCDGRSLTAIKYSKNLQKLVGTTVPDLQGMFLRGTGTSPVNAQDGPALGETQGDMFKEHDIHGVTTLSGNHTHFYNADTGAGIKDWPAADMASGIKDVSANFTPETSASGIHAHSVIGGSIDGGDETRPVNYGVNYIIKL